MAKNKYLTKEQQIRRSFFKGLSISVIITSVIVGIYHFYTIPHIKKIEKIKVLNNMEKDKGSELTVYALNKDIKQGEAITKNKCKVITLPKELLPQNCISNSNDLEGKIARMDLKNKTMLTNQMVCLKHDKLTDDLRKQDYDYIKLNQNLKVGDFIDVRYKKKTGEDYVVAAKKQILYVKGKIMITKISEKERQYINNASVKAAISEGTMYTTIYVDPENQPEANITYQLDNSIKTMIESNPNIVNKAKKTLKNGMEKDNANDVKQDIEQENKNLKPSFIEN